MPAGGKRSLDLSLVSSASKRRRSDKRKGERSRFCGVLRTDYQCRGFGFGSALIWLSWIRVLSENADPRARNLSLQPFHKDFCVGMVYDYFLHK
jgi:hypothetical protein